jgi:cholesterol transport system auxiliary component
VKRLTGRILVLPALCLAACTGSLFQSKAVPPAVYLLSPIAGSPAGDPAAPEAPKIAVDLAILKPRLRPGLESDRIAVLYPDRHLDYFAGARWSGPLGEVLQDLAVQEFRNHANLRSVSAADASMFASAYWLEIEVADFQAQYASAATVPTVHVHFLARLGSSADRRILAQFEANAQQPAAENRLSAIVDAYAHAADAAWGEIAAHTDETLAKMSEAR